jgi:hypothetical protein
VWYVGGILYLDFWRIDDPLEVFPVHALGGVWGLFATGFFDNNRGGLYHNAYKQGRFMGYQLVGITIIIAWISLFSIITFLILRKLHLLRVDPAVEEVGLDVAELGNVSEEFLDAVRQEIRIRVDPKSAVYAHNTYENEEETQKGPVVDNDPLKKEQELKGAAYIF